MLRWAGLLACILLVPGIAEPEDKTPAWILTFADEFNGTSLDLARWAPHDPFGYARDRQLQGYTPESLQVTGGMLHIGANRARVPVRYDGKEREYVSGIITTFGTFAQTYGRFEIRCRIPAGRGLRPGFLLLPIPSGSLPSIEVQAIGSTPARLFVANRWGTEQTERSYGDSFSGPDLSAGFHTIAVEWERDSIRWFIDGKQKFESADGIPHQPMYLLLDLAVGGTLAGAPDAFTTFPASFDIDYVHVYQRPSSLTPQVK